MGCTVTAISDSLYRLYGDGDRYLIVCQGPTLGSLQVFGMVPVSTDSYMFFTENMYGILIHK